jgi:FtsZ-binding cell division protein ZapB
MMTDIERLRHEIDTLRNDYRKLNAHVDAMERRVNESINKCMELQGRVTTLAGRIRGGER